MNEEKRQIQKAIYDQVQLSKKLSALKKLVKADELAMPLEEEDQDKYSAAISAVLELLDSEIQMLEVREEEIGE